MTAKIKFSNRLMSLVLSVILVVSCLPLTVLSASSANDSGITTTADPSNMDGWRQFFLPENGDLSTENAGGIWTNKSVFDKTTAAVFDGTGLSLDDDDNMLVALSAIASNKSVTGQSSVPTDTIFVLDVSGSMERSDVADDLAVAANASVGKLLENPKNRVGVVLYSGSSTSSSNSTAAVTLLPLGHYRTGSNGRYISYSNGDIVLERAVVYDGGANNGRRPSSTSKEVTGATYIQKGIILAMNQFTADSNTLDATENRKPVVVLMSDGAPTLTSSQFTNPDQFNMGMGNSESTNAAMGFVTQLSAAYAKSQITTKYGTNCLFYTMGLGTGSDLIATNVLNTNLTAEGMDAVSTTIRTYWNNYNALANGGELQVQKEGYGYNGRWFLWEDEYVTKLETPLSMNYVTEYFDSSKYTTSGNDSLSDALIKAFEEIVSKIELESAYYPTLVEGNVDFSGYITFVDRIGKYMTVTDVKGIVADGVLFSGADLSSNFVAGGGKLGTNNNPTALGIELVNAVKTRLGIDTDEEARALINLAYNYKQLSYTSATEFSNYIGWYANARGEYLGFWNEGSTTIPDPSNPTLTDATRPEYLIKSYGYLGKSSSSDMMYATVQVRKSITTGEEIVTFAIPAALIPTVTYEVTLDADGEVEELTAGGEDSPIRFLYEVGLDEEINKFTVKDMVSSEYIEANSNPDGSINFYTNQYETDNSVGYDKLNAYAYYRPSRENDRYYYQENSLIYTDTNGTVYEGTARPTGEMYHGYTVYTKTGSTYDSKTVYHRLTAETLETAHKAEDSNNWYVSAGDVRRDYYGYTVEKTANNTGTLTFSDAPFTDIYGHSVNDVNHRFVFGATLGNNGKLTLASETGVKISKALAPDATATNQAFTFNVEYPNAENKAYPAYKVNANGVGTETTVTFENGAAAVDLYAGEAIYIGGMENGDTVTVTENEYADYFVQSVNGDLTLTEANLEVAENDFVDAEFVNSDKGRGDLTVAKKVTHPLGTEYVIPDDIEFEITVTLTGIGTAEETFTAGKTASDITSITTDENGAFTVTLKNTEQIQLFDLPEGTKATVTENNIPDGFTAVFWDEGAVGDGVVTVVNNKTASVIVENQYTPTMVYPVNISVDGTKTLKNRDWSEGDSFTFELQRRNADRTFTTIATETVSYSDTDKNFSFDQAFSDAKYEEVGIYYYRVVEVEPEIKLGGVTYDKTIHAFAVFVTDEDMDGALEISQVTAYNDETTEIIETASGWNVTANFTNTYSATGDTTVVIDVNKYIENESGSTLPKYSGFKFGLYDATGTEVATATTTDSGLARFVLSDITEVGTHTFTVKEITPDVIPDGWSYSSETATVYVTVSDDGEGALSATISTNPTAVATATSVAVDFTNTYTPDPAELVIDFMSKELKNRALRNEEFTFEIYENGVDMENTDPLRIGKNNASGVVTFDRPFVYDKVGLYLYNAVEVNEGKTGIVYDGNIYRFSVRVYDDGGKLKTVLTVDTVSGDDIVFKNTYSPKPIPYAISGTKYLPGRKLLNDEFEFILTEALDANGTIGEKAKTVHAKNFEDGRFVFPSITYTEVGEYFYTVSELIPTEKALGVTYDETEYVVTVTVTDPDQNGELEALAKYVIKGNGTANALVFNNKYKAVKKDIDLIGTKSLEGRVLGDDEFTFNLYKSDETWAEKELYATAKNKADGTFTFKEISITDAGTYYFLVKEQEGDKGGITYDDAVYRVKITVTDNLKGEFITETVIFNELDMPIETILFNNIYEVKGTGTLTLNGEKTLTGKALKDGDFTFELYETDETFTVGEKADKTATNKARKFAFELDYGVEDIGETFYYAVKEKNGGKTIKNVTYDKTVYHITVSVEDDLLGGVKTVATILDGNETVDTLKFVNKYYVEEEEDDDPPGNPQTPDTGDATNLALWCAFLFISGGVMMTTLMLGKKKKEQTE